MLGGSSIRFTGIVVDGGRHDETSFDEIGILRRMDRPSVTPTGYCQRHSHDGRHFGHPLVSCLDTTTTPDAAVASV
jgi:hypothetical protein